MLVFNFLLYRSCLSDGSLLPRRLSLIHVSGDLCHLMRSAEQL